MLDTDTYRTTPRRRPPSRFFPLEAEELIRSGQVENAAELCKRGLVYFPENISGYAVLAQAYALLGQEERAVNVLEHGYRRTGAEGLQTLRKIIKGESLPLLQETEENEDAVLEESSFGEIAHEGIEEKLVEANEEIEDAGSSSQEEREAVDEAVVEESVAEVVENVESEATAEQVEVPEVEHVREAEDSVEATVEEESQAEEAIEGVAGEGKEIGSTEEEFVEVAEEEPTNAVEDVPETEILLEIAEEGSAAEQEVARQEEVIEEAEPTEEAVITDEPAIEEETEAVATEEQSAAAEVLATDESDSLSPSAATDTVESINLVDPSSQSNAADTVENQLSTQHVDPPTTPAADRAENQLSTKHVNPPTTTDTVENQLSTKHVNPPTTPAADRAENQLSTQHVDPPRPPAADRAENQLSTKHVDPPTTTDTVENQLSTKHVNPPTTPAADIAENQLSTKHVDPPRPPAADIAENQLSTEHVDPPTTTDTVENQLSTEHVNPPRPPAADIAENQLSTEHVNPPRPPAADTPPKEGMLSRTLPTIESGEEEPDAGGLQLRQQNRPHNKTKKTEDKSERRPFGNVGGESRTGRGGLSLHSGTKISRLSSSNLRLIPGLEFAPLRRDDDSKIRIAPLVNEPPPAFTLSFDSIIPGIPSMPSESAAAELPASENQTTALHTAEKAEEHYRSEKTAEAEAVELEEVEPIDLFPDVPENVPQEELASFLSNTEFDLAPAPLRPDPPAQYNGGMTPLEELARRLETARIPIVEEEADSYDSPAFEPSIVSDTFAAILVGQGAYAEAIKAYQMLARLKPERRHEYEQKIAEMRKKLKESN